MLENLSVSALPRWANLPSFDEAPGIAS